MLAKMLSTLQKNLRRRRKTETEKLIEEDIRKLHVWKNEIREIWENIRKIAEKYDEPEEIHYLFHELIKRKADLLSYSQLEFLLAFHDLSKGMLLEVRKIIETVEPEATGYGLAVYFHLLNIGRHDLWERIFCPVERGYIKAEDQRRYFQRLFEK